MQLDINSLVSIKKDKDDIKAGQIGAIIGTKIEKDSTLYLVEFFLSKSHKQLFLTAQELNIIDN